MKHKCSVSMGRLSVATGVACATLALFPIRAAGQCDWTPNFSVFPGLGGISTSVYATAVFDDGSGPALYVGGAFTVAGGVPANSIAKWDGASWSALGTGMDDAVYSLAVFDDGGGPDLYAAGFFTTAGGVSANRVARWDGLSWSALGSGMNDYVLALAVFDDGGGAALYAGGMFTTAGGASRNRIAKWNGTTWSALGTGANNEVSALGVFDDGGGAALYAGGSFTTAGGVSANRVAKWNGAGWSALGTGANAEVFAFTVFDDGSGPALYAAGFFTSAGGISASRIAKWNGSTWSALAGGGLNSTVRNLAAFDDGGGSALYAAGNFTTAGGAGANYLAKWNGSSWSSLGSGANNQVWSLTVFDDGGGAALYAGGDFTAVGGVIAFGIAAWRSSNWSALGAGFNSTVTSFSVFDAGGGPALYAGGYFGTIGGILASRIARWNGASWSNLGSGLDTPVFALTSFDDGGGPALYAGGSFTTAGGASANRIARWDGADWSALGSGMNNQVSALTVFDDGGGAALYAGGLFTTAGGASANRVAKWNGASWSALGTGTDGIVLALTVFDDGSGPALYAGGEFFTAGGMSTTGIAKWNGASWSALGTGMDGAVLALTVFDDGGGPALYAGGFFVTAGGVSVNRIAKWDGSDWFALGSGMDFIVYSLSSFDDGDGPALYAGGQFTTAGGVSANRIAKWDGSSWSALSSGMPGEADVVFALVPFNNGDAPTLYAGGDFLTAGGTASAYMAEWACAPPPPDCNNNGIDDATDIADCTGDPACSDCNANDVPDECDIADCIADPDCDDCNLNGQPDGCDISLAFSLDVNGDDVPDECASFVGGCVIVGQEDYWTCADNWEGFSLGPGEYPDDADSAAGVFATLPGGVDVFLDDTVEIPALRLALDSQLRITQVGPAGDLEFSESQPGEPGKLMIQGTLLLDDGRSVGPASGAPAPDVTILPGGFFDAFGTATAGNLRLRGAPPAEARPDGRRGITPPPKLKISSPSSIQVAGMIYMQGVVESSNTSSGELSLDGDFKMQSVIPSLFDWTEGNVIIAGNSPQAFEVAGIDLGATTLGFATDADALFDADPHTNFSIGSIEVAPGSIVQFVNQFASTVGVEPCDEALYVRTLTLSAGSEATLDNVRVYAEVLDDQGATLNTIGCGALLLIPAFQPLGNEPGGMSKGRFLSFVVPSDAAGTDTALRVELTSLHHPSSPPPGTPDFTSLEGQFRYVNSFGGATLCVDSATFSTNYRCGQLGCQPEYRDWAAELQSPTNPPSTAGLIHVTGDAVAPSSTLSVSHISGGCGSAPAADTCVAASAALAVSTSRWGDVGGGGGGPSDGAANVIDIGLVVDNVKGLATAIVERRAWMKSPTNPFGNPVNVIDIGLAVDAVKGLPYPYGIAACP